MDLKKDLADILKAMKEHNLTKIAVKNKDFEVVLEKEGSGLVAAQPMMMQQGVAQHHEAPPPPATVKQEEAIYITSPIVGTFYAAISPEEPSFVKVGDQVENDKVVCIIEAMKVMNEVKSSECGKIVEVLVKNGDPVEYGTKLFKLA